LSQRGERGWEFVRGLDVGGERSRAATTSTTWTLLASPSSRTDEVPKPR
jgi:hypothetical protein